MAGFDGVEVGFFDSLDAFVINDDRAGVGEAVEGRKLREDVFETGFGSLGLKLDLVGEGEKDVGRVGGEGTCFASKGGFDQAEFGELFTDGIDIGSFDLGGFGQLSG